MFSYQEWSHIQMKREDHQLFPTLRVAAIDPAWQSYPLAQVIEDCISEIILSCTDILSVEHNTRIFDLLLKGKTTDKCKNQGLLSLSQG